MPKAKKPNSIKKNITLVLGLFNKICYFSVLLTTRTTKPMKKSILIALITVFSFSLVSAQEQAVKANPLGLIFGIANAGYEFSINETQTVTISGIYYGLSGISGAGLGGEYRFYLSSGEALKGWHAGPAVSYFALSDNFNNSSGFVNIGGEGGHQWILNEHFLIDAFATLGFITGGSSALSVSGASFGIGASLGYAW